MSPPSTTGSAPVAGEAQWAGAGHPALRPALLLCARRLCARRRDQVLAHGARDEDGVDDEPLAPVRGGADVWVAGSVDAAAFVETEVDHHAPPAAAGPAWATSAPQISAHTACKRTALTGGHYPIAALSVAQRAARTQRRAVTLSKRRVLRRGSVN